MAKTKPKTSEQAKLMYIVPEELIQNILDYLITCQYCRVAPLIGRLMQLKPERQPDDKEQ